MKKIIVLFITVLGLSLCSCGSTSNEKKNISDNNINEYENIVGTESNNENVQASQEKDSNENAEQENESDQEIQTDQEMETDSEPEQEPESEVDSDVKLTEEQLATKSNYINYELEVQTGNGSIKIPLADIPYTKETLYAGVDYSDESSVHLLKFLIDQIDADIIYQEKDTYYVLVSYLCGSRNLYYTLIQYNKQDIQSCYLDFGVLQNYELIQENKKVSFDFVIDQMGESYAKTLVVNLDTMNPDSVGEASNPPIDLSMQSATVPVFDIRNDYLQEFSLDIDEDGNEEFLQFYRFSTYLYMYRNNEKVYEYSAEIRLAGIRTIEAIDIDRDNKNELFITIYTFANSRPYEDVLCLKQAEDTWLPLSLPKNYNDLNEFSFSITRGENEFEFVISSEETDQIVTFDASCYFVDDGTDIYDTDSSAWNTIQFYRANQFKKGDEVGYISSWGIWEAESGTYNGRPCVIASQGIEGLYGIDLGALHIAFAYNEQGDYEILNVEYVYTYVNSSYVELIPKAQFLNDSLEFIDMNFDGFLDVRVRKDYNAYGEPYYLNYIWNNKEQKWETNQTLDSLIDTKFYKQDKILTSCSAGSLVYNKEELYEFRGDELRLLALLEYNIRFTEPVIVEETVTIYKDGEEYKQSRELTDEEARYFDREEIYQYLKNYLQ